MGQRDVQVPTIIIMVWQKELEAKLLNYLMAGVSVTLLFDREVHTIY